MVGFCFVFFTPMGNGAFPLLWEEKWAKSIKVRQKGTPKASGFSLLTSAGSTRNPSKGRILVLPGLIKIRPRRKALHISSDTSEFTDQFLVPFEKI